MFHTDIHLLARVALACALAFAFGFVWAGLMFVSAAVNVVAALNLLGEGWRDALDPRDH